MYPHPQLEPAPARITDQIQLWFVELPKFRCKVEELSSRRQKWIYYLKYADQLSHEEVKSMDMPELQRSDAKLRVISREHDFILADLSKMKARRDAANLRYVAMGPLQNNVIDSAFASGWASHAVC